MLPMDHQKNKTRGILLIIAIAFTLILQFSFCSRQVFFEKLREKNEKYYHRVDSQPLTGKTIKRDYSVPYFSSSSRSPANTVKI
jgi:hypothetical protein